LNAYDEYLEELQELELLWKELCFVFVIDALLLKISMEF
jgi:hypothetical protein